MLVTRPVAAHLVIGQGDCPQFLTGLLPIGYVTPGVIDSFIHPALGAKVKVRIEIRHSVEKNTGLASINRLPGHHVGVSQILYAGQDNLFPLAVYQVGGNKMPGVFGIRVALAIIDAELV